MYGKVFDSIYDGTLYGHWEAIVTMQQMIVLASPDGVVDMTPQAMAARTSIPLDIIQKGLKVLAEPDPYTRTPGEDGRRIVLMDEHRPWGWRLVNHGKYMRLRNIAQKREADRVRIAAKRNQNKDVATVSQPVANVAHSDSYSDTDSKNKDIVRLTPDPRQQAKEVLSFLNEKTGRAYEPVDANLKLIIARLKDGATAVDLRQVVAKKCREWIGDPKMAEYLRPKTLFNATNFAQYKGELVNVE
jgi:uncharacterized phage protein (TIGR02220 family)